MSLQELEAFQGQFAIVVEDGVVVEIGKTFFLEPELHFAGGEIRWVEEKRKPKKE